MAEYSIHLFQARELYHDYVSPVCFVVCHNDELLQRVKLTNIPPKLASDTPTSIHFYNAYMTNGSALLGCESLQPLLEHAFPKIEDLQLEEKQMRLTSYLAASSCHSENFLDTAMNLDATYLDLTLFAATHVEGRVPLQDVAPDTITKLSWETKER